MDNLDSMIAKAFKDYCQNNPTIPDTQYYRLTRRTDFMATLNFEYGIKCQCHTVHDEFTSIEITNPERATMFKLRYG